jgi:hypothetical protein
METKQFTRKPFPVNAVQVGLDNVHELAEWCGGTVEMKPTKMMGTTTDLPVIILKGQGENRGKDFEAALGCWVVELKGSFRVYKPAQFEASFDEYVEETRGLSDDPADPDFDGVTFMQAQLDKVDAQQI